MINTKDLFSLEGRVAIVTGGRGMYGASISLGLCEMGATVVISSRNGEKCEEFAKELREKGHSAYGMSLDLNSDASIEAFVQAVVERFGRIDVLVNNAVDRSNLTGFMNATREKLQDSMSTNLNGQIVLSKTVAEHMKKQGKGSIINVSSMRGLDSPHFPFYAPEARDTAVNYTTEKWAMIGLTKYMAGLLGEHHIRVNSIAPGGYNTDMSRINPDFIKTYIDNCPLHCWATEDDIKGPIAFLASDASNYVTGETLVMDGGWTIW